MLIFHDLSAHPMLAKVYITAKRYLESVDKA